MTPQFGSNPNSWRTPCAWLALTLLVAGTTAWRALRAEDDKPGTSNKAKLQQLRKERANQKDRTAERKASVHQTPDNVDYIDELLEQEWKALGFPVSEPASEGEFLRRASLDIIGRIPRVDEVKAYLHERGPNRRAKLIERLIASEEFGANFANVWTRLLITDGNEAGNNQDVNPDSLHAWLQTQFNRNTPWNEIVTQLISATGRWDENPAVNFVVANQLQGGNNTQVTSYLTRLFLCVQTQCTECHDHPWNEWKQEQFHGINAFFLGTRERRVTRTLPTGQVATDYYVLDDMPYQKLADKGTFFERRSGLTVFAMPTYLDGRDIHALLRGAKAPTSNGQELSSAADEPAFRFLNEDDERLKDPIYLREVLARVVTGDDNPYFARAMVNRVWYHFFGHSFTKNVDDFDNGVDEPTMPELLDRLAEDFKANDHDVKRLVGWICSTKAYGLSSKIKGKPSEEAVGFFTCMLVKPLTPEQLYDSTMTLTQIDKTAKTANAGAERRQFLREIRTTFGTSDTPTTAPKYEGTITQALMLMNSPLVARVTSCTPGTFLHTVATDKSRSDDDKLEELYFAALARRPSGNEKATMARLFRAAKSPADAFQDVLWVLMNSPEFVMNH